MTKEKIFGIITDHTKKLIPELTEYDFKYDDRLADLGANSVDRAEIVTMTLESLSLKIPRVELFGVKNIGELTDALYAKCKTE